MMKEVIVFRLNLRRKFDVKISIGLIYRLMLDIDNTKDLEFVIKQNIKPDFCQKIKKNYSIIIPE